MTDLSRSCFALNKLIFSRCKSTVQKRKKKRNPGTFSKFITGLPNQESAGQILKGIMFRLKLKENEKTDKAGQPNLLHFVLLSAFLSLSQRSGSPGITITLVYTEHTFMCFIFKDVKAAFVNVLPPSSFRFLQSSESFPRMLPSPLYESK